MGSSSQFIDVSKCKVLILAVLACNVTTYYVSLTLSEQKYWISCFNMAATWSPISKHIHSEWILSYFAISIVLQFWRVIRRVWNRILSNFQNIVWKPNFCSAQASSEAFRKQSIAPFHEYFWLHYQYLAIRKRCEFYVHLAVAQHAFWDSEISDALWDFCSPYIWRNKGFEWILGFGFKQVSRLNK